MEHNRVEQFDKIVKTIRDGYRALTEYWLEWSIYTAFEFWLMVLLFIASLAFVLIKIDKEKIFLIGFYGYSIHMTIGYLDMYGRNMGFWNFPFPLIPGLPGLVLDSSIVPVIFMMVYQWTLNHNKNYYLYSFLTACFFAFIFKPSMEAIGVLKLYGKANYFHLLIVYVTAFLISRFLTNLFLWLQKKYSKQLSH
ncbi:hypothetical protein [Calidifontibacillus oryziterrae]|uniref:hypothetical protein n=1 Tax=Calidifontibacillus oryziterrae TaxID=1191699 RepID=UPI0002F1C057|nr:hypothetical protein [Calidifontibacillus oryziterrae]